MRSLPLTVSFVLGLTLMADAEPTPTPVAGLLAGPEALIPPDAQLVFRGAGLERLQSQIDAFCNRFPCALATRLRQKAADVLSRPWLVAADGTRPWAAVCPRLGDEPAFVLPVEDAQALRQAVAASFPEAQVRTLKGYAVVGRDAALVERLAHPPDAAPTSAFAEDLSIHLGGGALRALAEPRLALLPASAADLVRSFLAQASGMDTSCSFGEAGLKVTIRLLPVPGSRLEALLARQSPQPARWLGLAPEGAMLALETHLDADASGACLRALERVRPSEGGKAAALLTGLWDGEACLACFHHDSGWIGQAVCRPPDPGRAEGLLEGSVWADGSAFRDPWTGRIWRCQRGEWTEEKEGEPRLRRLLVSADPPEGAAEGTGLSAGVAACFLEGLLVTVAGRDAQDRLVKTAPPLAKKMEARLSPAAERLLEGLPSRTANLWLLLCPRQALALLGRLRGGEAAALPADAPSLAACLRCGEGRAELDLLLPGEVLADLPGMERVLKDLLSWPSVKGVSP